MARFELPVMNINVSAPADSASSGAYWMSGLSTMGSISFGLALVSGRKRVPRPATGKTTAFTGCAIPKAYRISDSRAVGHFSQSAQLYDRVRLETVPRMAGRTMPVKVASGKSALVAAIFLRMRQQRADFL